MRLVFKTVLYGEDKNRVLAVDIDSAWSGLYTIYDLFGECLVSKDYIQSNTRNAKPVEITATKTKVERLGYNVEIVKSLRG